MNIGMLWFDNTPNLSLQRRIEKAQDYYRRKYHQEPTICLVSPRMIGTEPLPTIPGLEIRAWRPVIPGYLWIGVEET